MSKLRSLDNDFLKTKSHEPNKDFNKLPDGRYTVEIYEVSVNEKDDRVLIFIRFKVAQGEFAGEMGTSVISITDGKYREYGIQDLKSFIDACELKVLPSELDNEIVRDGFRGFVLAVKKQTNAKGYAQWKYWEFVSAPENLADTGDQFDDDAPLPEESEAPKSEEEINLDEDPFD